MVYVINLTGFPLVVPNKHDTVIDISAIWLDNYTHATTSALRHNIQAKVEATLY